MKKHEFDLNKRFLLQGAVLGCCTLLLPKLIVAGAQKEEHLADSVASAMSRSVNGVNQARLIFSTEQAGQAWFTDMDSRLSRFVTFAPERKKILVNLQYEASRAGLDPQLVLGLIEVESRFRRYAISSVGAMGLMQVMPFWVRAIGKPNHNLFDTVTNLRYGCIILRYYLDREKGDLFRALVRYNGSLGKAKYPNAVLGAMHKNWLYSGVL